jgi:DNA adenine methylase
MHVPGMKKAYTYLGSKYSMLPWLLPLLHRLRRKAFIDVCGGSGVVLFNMEPSNIEVYNDINQKCVNFLSVLRNQKEALLEQLLLTPHSRYEYEYAWDLEGDTDLEKARKFFVRVQQSFLATGSQNQLKGWLSSIREHRWHIAQATHKWLSTIEGLPEIVDRLAMVQLENKDIEWILEKYDDKESVFYIDPPYDMQHRSSVNDYEFDFSVDDHTRVRNKVENCRGAVAISGYDSDFMKQLYKDWHFYQGPVRRNNYSDKVVHECLWSNVDLSKSGNHGRLF